MVPELIPVYRQSARSHPPGGRLLLLSVRPAVTFPAAKHHRPLAGTKLYCFVTELYRCEQLAQGLNAYIHISTIILVTYNNSKLENGRVKYTTY